MAQEIRVARQAVLPYGCDSLFLLVADIERYPDFLTGCRRARILSRQEDQVIAELEIAKAGLHQSFSTRNTNHFPNRIDMSLVRGPFRSLRGSWVFEPITDGGCRVSFELVFHMRPSLLSRLMAALVSEVANDLVDAISHRAHDLFRSEEQSQCLK